MWRKRLLSVGISMSGLTLFAAGTLGVTSTGAGADTLPPLPTSSLPVSVSAPITALENQDRGHCVARSGLDHRDEYHHPIVLGGRRCCTGERVLAVRRR